LTFVGGAVAPFFNEKKNGPEKTKFFADSEFWAKFGEFLSMFRGSN